MPERIWIIGASDGIGAALARLWSNRGAELVLSARSEDRLVGLNEALGGHHTVLPLDLGDHASFAAAVETLSQAQPLDRIIHMAAMYDPGKVSEVSLETASNIVSVNLTGSLMVAQAAPRLLKPQGQLAMCGSVAGYYGLPQGQIYSATKAGVVNLVESLKAELHGKVDVRLISPGFVDTRLTQKNEFDMPGLMSPDEAAQKIVDGLNSNRFEIHFPRRLTLPLKLLRLLPYGLAFPLTRRLVR